AKTQSGVEPPHSKRVPGPGHRTPSPKKDWRPRWAALQLPRNPRTAIREDAHMSMEGSVTHWLTLLQAGDRAAVGPLWERYFPLLVARARASLQARSSLAADEEDAALSALDSFCRGAEEGRFPQVPDRDE